MVEVQIRNNNLSSRESEILSIFRKHPEGAISTEFLRRETDLDHSRIHRTIEKLIDKGYLKQCTKQTLQFYKPDRDKLEEALEEMAEEEIISKKSEVIS